MDGQISFNVTADEQERVEYCSKYIFDYIEVTERIEKLIEKYAKHENVVDDLVDDLMWFKEKYTRIWREVLDDK